ncbi:MAG: hypothetical protein JWP66_320 [Naasia sp.]|nr:hypothetical protein [Naasia sp.]
MSRTTQLRRYELAPGAATEFTAWWRGHLVPARVRHGFRVDFAWLRTDGGEFTWAVSVAGDAEEFARAEAVYLESEERTAAFAAGDPLAWVIQQHIDIVDPVATR